MDAAPSRFRTEDLSANAAIILRRLGENDHELCEPFSYIEQSGRIITLEAGLVTDIASVPAQLAWLVPKDGRHTPAAILHDALILGHGEKKKYLADPARPPILPAEGDRIFRRAMGDLEVPFIRRWLMWAAVSLRTITHRDTGKMKRLMTIGIGLHVAAAAVLGALLPFMVALSSVRIPAVGWDIARGPYARAWVIVVLACAAWGKRWGVGLITTLTLAVFSAPMVSAYAGFALYYVPEFIVSRLVDGRLPAVSVVEQLDDLLGERLKVARTYRV